MKKISLSLFLLLTLSLATRAQTPKYVFLFIGDGMGINQSYVTDVYNRAINGAPLNFLDFPVRTFVSTCSASSGVTDSSAAGTALATGRKTTNSFIGVAPDAEPLTTLAEMAKRSGLGAGVVTSVGVNHATPGAFYAHSQSRYGYDEISRQLLDSPVDFAAGANFISEKGSEMSASDWVGAARQKGIVVYEGAVAYAPVKGKRVILLADDPARDHLQYAIDRREGQTSLRDFTAAAIDHLYSNFRKGFFLMVEGGMIDYANHSRDLATAIDETLDMAASVQLALDFAAKHPSEVLIVVTADHETGGFIAGAGHYEMHPERMEAQKVSKDALTDLVRSLRRQTDNKVEWRQIKDLLTQTLGLWDSVPVSKKWEKVLTQTYKESFLDREGEDEKDLYSSHEQIVADAVKCLQDRAQVSYSMYSHSGSPVPLCAWGAGSAAFGSCKDNTDIPKTIARVAKYK